MKRQLLAAVGIALACNAGAQTQRGNGLISGSVGVTHNQSKSPQFTYSQFGWQPNLNLTAGRFVADNYLLGLSVAGRSDFGEIRTQVSSPLRPFPLRSSRREVSVTTTPFVRRYVRLDPVYLFAGAGVSVGVGSSDQTERAFDYQTNQLTTANRRTHNFAVNPYLEVGVNYFLTGRLALQLTANARSLPFTTGGFNTGLTYWTGPDRQTGPQPERDNPQTNRGNWLVEGSFSVGASGYRQEGNGAGEATVRTYGVAPSIGYFTGKNSLAGVRVAYGLVDNSSPGTAPDRADTWSVAIAPYYQRYLASTRLTPYVSAAVTYQVTGPRGGGEETAKSLAGNVSLGLAYMAGQRFIVETSLATPSFTYFIPGESFPDARSWNAGLSAGLSGNFAIRYVLTRAK